VAKFKARLCWMDSCRKNGVSSSGTRGRRDIKPERVSRLSKVVPNRFQTVEEELGPSIRWRTRGGNGHFCALKKKKKKKKKIGEKGNEWGQATAGIQCAH